MLLPLLMNLSMFTPPVPPTPAIPPTLESPGGGGQGTYGSYRSAVAQQQARHRREAEELAIILQAIMPMIAEQENAVQEITLGERNG